MTLQILGKTFMHEVWVCNKINDLIFGADLINSHHLQYDTLSWSIHFWNKPHAPILSLKEVTHFEALSTTIVKTNFLGDLPPSKTHIASIVNGNHILLQGGPALVTIYDDEFCTIGVTNCAPYDIKLPRDSVIAHLLHEGDQSDIEPMQMKKPKN